MDCTGANAGHQRGIWLVGISVLIVMLACAVVFRSSPDGPPPSPTKTAADLPDGRIPERTEPVGWVFGRVVGFEGADKPLLPRRSPAPFLSPGPRTP